ncbi:histidine kinase dimerization/phospho-acceptor domain-containing protein [Janthinobacterium sp. J1-1]|uniref:histidine kinase dimerization/phospho-acceptor domain-containing protein n=1 Tax=Janthinobacterium sp. J1-1 TaxID=3065910 RepID=UPI002811FED9|nr:histidine kinase dimerization/phospho-acceptor domain-containing protein [Janthinobacterium sp. J1-1]
MMKTIRQQLLLGLLGTALICILASAYFLYQSLLHEVNELADLQLRQLALALPDEFLPGTGSRAPEDPEEEYTLQAWDQAGQPLRLSVSQQLMPRYVLDGFLTVSLRGQEWRIYGKTRNARYVQVAQAVAVRDLLAVRMALRAGAPLLVLAFVLAVMILVVVEHALKPLERLAQTMAGKSADALVPVVEEDMPPDLRPVVKAINGLMYRFDNALIAQRAFIADAAHELRSPLTAMTLQLQLVERAIGDRAKAIALSKLSERLNRTTHLVRQLLSLARHEGSAHQIRMQKVDLGSLLQNAVADHSAFAESREIDLGVDSSGAVVVQADPDG